MGKWKCCTSVVDNIFHTLINAWKAEKQHPSPLLIPTFHVHIYGVSLSPIPSKTPFIKPWYRGFFVYSVTMDSPFIIELVAPRIWKSKLDKRKSWEFRGKEKKKTLCFLQKIMGKVMVEVKENCP